MDTHAHHLIGPLLLALLLLLVPSAQSLAQDAQPQTAAVVKQLTGLLDAQKLDAIAARDPAGQDLYVAALYFPGQLMVVSAKYSVPVLLNDKLAKKDYRDIYMDLNSASDPKTKVLIMDLGADGLKPKVDDNHLDTYEAAGKSWSFNGDWKAQNTTEDAYMKAFAEADGRYAKMLQALIVQLKKTSED